MYFDITSYIFQLYFQVSIQIKVVVHILQPYNHCKIYYTLLQILLPFSHSNVCIKKADEKKKKQM